MESPKSHFVLKRSENLDIYSIAQQTRYVQLDIHFVYEIFKAGFSMQR